MESPNFSLEELADQATKYCLNLNAIVDRDPAPSFRGGNALVYKGTLRSRGALVAIKTVLSPLPGDLETIKGILREAHVWSKLEHENILPLLGITTKFDLTVSIVSQWMAAGRADYYVKDPVIDPRPLIIGIARGLSYLHNHHLGPIVHGDLKGSNVLISDNGHALITDFGYTLLKNSSFKITLSLPCGGTYNWMSPEIVESWEREDECKTTTQSDVWAFGMTALELFTRKIPFDHLKNWQGIRRRILQGPPDRPTDCLTHYRMSDDWWGICLECWTSIPLSRPSISQILNKVEATKAIMDATQLLTLVSKRATHFCVNLNELVDRNPKVDPIRHGDAIVFQGTLRSEGTRLKVKTIRAGLPAGDKCTIDEILREIYLWTGVRHENIVPLLGISTKFDHSLSIVSEWTGTMSAHQYVQNIAIDPRPLLLGIVEGVNYLHSHKPGPLCHGDLKGLNIIVSDDGKALLTFGITALVHALFQPGTKSFKRPPNWVTPEELECGKFTKTPEGDIWAFGMTALELFTRKPPFHDIKSDTDVKAQVMRGPPGRPSDEEACSRLTDGWWDICLLCWKFDPLSRPKIPAITSKIKQLMCTVSTSSLNTQIATEDTAWSPSSNTNSDRVCRQGTGTVATQSSWPNVNLDADYSTDASRHTSLSQLPDTSGSSGNLSNTSELQVQDGGGHSDPTPEMPRVSNGPSNGAYEEFTAEDIIIAVMGTSGTGKSLFISQVTGNEDGVGHQLTSCTSDIGVTKCTILGFPVVLVDTPGFDDTEISDVQVLEMISDWLVKTYRRKVLLSFILFFHRITDNRMSGTPLRNLQVFQKLCGHKAMSRVILVTTMWDEIEVEIGQERLDELKGGYWKPMIAKGSKTFEHRNDPSSALELLEMIVHDKGERTRVALQREITDLKMKLPETGAGQELCSCLEQLAQEQLKILRQIRGKTRNPIAKESEGDLRKEYAELRFQLDATLSQVQALELSLAQRIVVRLRRTWRQLALTLVKRQD